MTRIYTPDNPQVSLGQAYSLMDIWLKTNSNITKHWDIDASKDIFFKLSNNQKKLIIALLAQKDYFKINEVFEKWGVMRK
jgi:hypothetical protein